jgi:hypothetical protein
MLYKVLRGQRIKEVLDFISEESSYDDLDSNIDMGFPNTAKRQHVADEVRIVQMKVTPYVKTNEIKVEAVGQNTKSFSINKPIILFKDVEYEEESTTDNQSFTAVDNNEYHVQKVEMAEHTCKVRCTCMDFYHRFSSHNHGDDSLQGQPMPAYVRKTNNRPPVNPFNVPGMCKHIIALALELQDSGLIR